MATDVALADSVTFSAAADAAYDISHRWNVRQQADGSGYFGRIRITSDGQATLGLSRLNGSSSTWLGGVTLPITIEPGQSTRTELEVSGASTGQRQDARLGRRNPGSRLAGQLRRQLSLADICGVAWWG